MSLHKLKALAKEQGFEIKKVPLNFVGIRKLNSDPDKFDEVFHLIFKAPVIVLKPGSKSKTEIDKVYGFQKIYTALVRIEDCENLSLTVDGIAGPKTLEALIHYTNHYVSANVSWEFEFTTRSGNYYLRKPLSKKGTAMLVSPGQYKYVRGRHKTQEAFVQGEPFKVFRDNDKDDRSEKTDVTEVGYFGINLHRRKFGLNSDTIGRWSAGCQVFRYGKEFQMVVNLADGLISLKKQFVFPYTLLDE